MFQPELNPDNICFGKQSVNIFCWILVNKILYDLIILVNKEVY